MLLCKTVLSISRAKAMNNQLQKYLTDATGLDASCEPLSGGHLPQYLRQAYDLYRLKVGPQHFLGIFLREGADLKPATFEKHLPKLWPKGSDEWAGYCLVVQALPGYLRKRLVERRIPYMIPGYELYWPALGVLVKARRPRGFSSPALGLHLGPAAQLLVLLGLTGAVQQQLTPKELAETMGYTAMTMTRALNELEAHKLAQVVRQGRERHLSFVLSKRALWEKALPVLRNPCREIVRVSEAALRQSGVAIYRAGESALAEHSMLTVPQEPVYALSAASWRRVRESLEIIPIQESDTCLVQIWRYDPQILAKGEDVDLFSLWLSLQDNKDERVAQALDKLIEEALA